MYARLRMFVVAMIAGSVIFWLLSQIWLRNLQH